MLKVWKQTGKQPAQLAEQPTQPEELAYLWAWFCELRSPVTWAEIDAWARRAHPSLSGWEAEQLVHLDRLRNAT